MIFVLSEPAPAHAGCEFPIAHFTGHVGANDILVRLKSCSVLREYLRKVCRDKPRKTRIRRIARPNVVVAQIVFVTSLIGQFRFRFWEKLVEGLMYDDSTGIEYRERGEVDTASDECRHGIELIT